MITQIKKWGNSYALRVPVSVMKELNLSEGQTFSFDIKDGKFVYSPQQKTRKQKYQELIDGCEVVTTTQNQEIWNDELIGNEII